MLDHLLLSVWQYVNSSEFTGPTSQARVYFDSFDACHFPMEIYTLHDNPAGQSEMQLVHITGNAKKNFFSILLAVASHCTCCLPAIVAAATLSFNKPNIKSGMADIRQSKSLSWTICSTENSTHTICNTQQWLCLQACSMLKNY